MRNIDITTIRFPSIKLETRAAHKLRGFFGNQYREIQELHNHLDDGTVSQRYPVVQYKVLDNVPTLVGLGVGSGILTKLINRIEFINIDDRVLPITNREISTRSVSIGVGVKLQRYRFDNMWMALNTRNFDRYMSADLQGQIEILRSILIGNMLVFLGAFNEIADREILAVPELETSKTRFKGLNMLGFKGHFQTNVLLPDGIGLGKSVSRGFGAISTAAHQRPTQAKMLRPRFRSTLPQYRRRDLVG